MALERSIPKASSQPIDKFDRFTTEWYSFLQQLASQATSATLQAELEALAARVLALEDSGQSVATILGLGSVLASGSLADGQVVLTLVGDTEEPGATYYYGTGPDGLKGWYAVADTLAAGENVTLDTDPDTGVTTINAAGGGGVPYFIPDGTTYSVPQYTQALFAMPIDTEGLLAVDGFLIGVD